MAFEIHMEKHLYIGPMGKNSHETYEEAVDVASELFFIHHLAKSIAVFDTEKQEYCFEIKDEVMDSNEHNCAPLKM